MLYSWSWQDICIFLDFLASTVEINLLFKTHKMTVVGKGLWGLCNPPPCSKQYQLELVAEGLVQSGFEYLRGCRLHKLSRQFLCFISIMDKPPWISVCAHSVFFSQLSPVRTVWLHLLYCPLPDIFKYLLESSLLQGELAPHSSYIRCSSPLITSVALFWTCTSISISLLCWGAQDLTRYFKCDPPKSNREERSLTSSVVLRSLNIDLLNFKIFLVLDVKNKYLFQPDSQWFSFLLGRKNYS